MGETDESDRGTYVVVMNDEEQYSIWPEHRPLPPGWRSVGFSGQRDACLAHVEEVWRDMRPRSLRQALDAASTRP